MALDDHIYCSPYLSVVSLNHLYEKPGEDGRAFDVRDPQPDAGVLLDRRYGAQTIRSAVAALPPRQRIVIVALFFAEMTVTRTARMLGISASAVVKLRTKALKRLLASLSPHRAALLA